MKISGGLRVFRLFPAAVLRIRGEDAPGFLQGQFSKDLRGIAPAEARYGLWLTVKGKVLADSYIVKLASDFLVASSTSPAGVIRQRLEDFIIADDVIVDDETDQWSMDLILGEGATQSHGSPGALRLPYPGREDVVGWLRLRGEAPAEAGLPELDRAGFERLRIDAVFPEIPRDLGAEELPHEGGLEDLAISYDKGCYLGQEIMARLKTRGRVRRRLVRVSGSGPLPPLPAAVSLGGKRSGELRSAVEEGSGFVGLALLPADAAKGQRYSVGHSGAFLTLG